MPDNDAERVDRPPILTDDDAAILDHAIDPVAEGPSLDSLPQVRYTRARVPSIPPIDRLTARTMTIAKGVPYLIVAPDPWRKRLHIDLANTTSTEGVYIGTSATAVTQGSDSAGIFYAAYQDIDIEYNGELWILCSTGNITLSYFTISSRPTERN